ncbi:UNVERIFIED_CONTAM: hypothetical protein FKN15_003522, partial [Acipenser sinensis]
SPPQDIGKNIYTIKEVVNEIRDKETKKRLAFLPYTLQFKDPFPEFIQLVTEFSKKTGDYPSLSATDIKVLALTYQLESEHVGINHLKHEPEIKVQVSSTRQHPEAPVNIAGFHLPSKKHQKSAAGTSSTQSQTPESSEFNTFQFWRNPLPSIEADLLDFLNAELVSVADSSTGVGDHLSRESHEGDGDSKEGIVTMRCIFIFQYLRTTSNMTKVFCPNCGNKTLKKIAVTIKEDGSFQMHFSRNPKVLNPKGMRYSLPKPQGGKHANNPHLVEDQHFPQQRLSRKARQKTNVFDPDYTAGGSPFAENDIYSRAANLNIRDSQSGAGRRRVNPNTANKKFVKKR